MSAGNIERWDEDSIPNSGSPSDFESIGGTDRLGLISWWVPTTTMMAFHTAVSHAAYRISEVSGTPRSPVRGEEGDERDAEFETRRSRLIAALRRLKDSAPTWSGVSTKINPASALTAEQFLLRLAPAVALPKVAPDGEGDVMFVWDQPGKECVVTVEPKLLHLVSKPGDPAGVQISAQRFLGIQIPPSILRHLPTK
jgi:hypothetical protein